MIMSKWGWGQGRGSGGDVFDTSPWELGSDRGTLGDGGATAYLCQKDEVGSKNRI